MNTKYMQMREEAIRDIIETLDNGYNGYYCDLHNEVFNTDYYIVGIYQARQALNEFDVWEALDKVKEYEIDNFGELYTDLTDAEKVVNMLYYIIGDEIITEMYDEIPALKDNWDNYSDEEINAEIITEMLKMYYPITQGVQGVITGGLTEEGQDMEATA